MVAFEFSRLVSTDGMAKDVIIPRIDIVMRSSISVNPEFFFIVHFRLQRGGWEISRLQ